MEFYSLKIDGNKIKLDDVVVKGVHGYKLEQTGADVPLLTLCVYVEPTVEVNK